MQHSKSIPLALIGSTVYDPARRNMFTRNGAENSAGSGLRDIVPTGGGKERSGRIRAYPSVKTARLNARAAANAKITINYRKNEPILTLGHGNGASRATSGTRSTTAAMRWRLKQRGNFSPFHSRHAVTPPYL